GIPALLRAAVDIDPAVRQTALEALNKIDAQWPKNPQTPKAIQDLISALADRDANLASEAGKLLCTIGAPAVAPLVQALSAAADDGRQLNVLVALGKIGRDFPDGVPALRRALASQHP